MNELYEYGYGVACMAAGGLVFSYVDPPKWIGWIALITGIAIMVIGGRP